MNDTVGIFVLKSGMHDFDWLTINVQFVLLKFNFFRNRFNARVLKNILISAVCDFVHNCYRCLLACASS